MTAKRILIFLALQLIVVKLFSQAPPLINYQAVARESSGQPITSQAISVKFEFKQGGATVFSETQSNITTNASGLFSTQIGKITSLAGIDWQAGNTSLEVSVDPAGGSSFVTFSSQQLVSVPYAMHAATVPSGYANNVLTIGGKTYTLTAATAATSVTANSGIAIITSAGTNTFDVNVPAPVYNAATGALTTGTAVSNITPTLTLAGGVLTSGPSSNSVIIPAAATPSITGTGAAAVTPFSGQSFTVNVPPTNVIASTGIATVTSAGTNSFDVRVPAPAYNAATGALTTGTAVTNITQSLTLAGGILTAGPSTNSVTIPAQVTPTIIPSGVASVTTVGSSFTVNAPAPSYNASTGSLTTGTSVINITPTLTLAGGVLTSGPSTNSVLIPAAASPTIIPSGVASVTTAGSSFTVNAPAPSYNTSTGALNTGTATTNITQSLTISGGVLTSGPSTNSVIIPAAAAPSITPSGVASVTTSGSSFTVNAPAPSYNTSTGALNTGTATTNITQSLTISGGVLTSGPSTNSVIIPAAAAPSITPSGVASVTTSGSSFTVNAPAPSYNQGSGALTTGTAVTNITQTLGISGNTLTVGPSTNTISLPAAATPTIVSSGVISVTTAGNSFTVDAPIPFYNPANGMLTSGTTSTNVTPTLAISGNTLTIGPSTNTISLPAAITPTITPSGVASVTTSGSSFTVNAPAPAYNSGSGALTTGTAVTNITQSLTLVSGVLTSGPSTNSVTIPAQITPTIIAAGITSVTASGSSFTVNVPAPAYTPSTGALVFGTNTVIAVPTLSFTNSILTSGPSVNSVNLGLWTSTGTSGQFLQSAGTGSPPAWVNAGTLSGGTNNYLPKWNSASSLSSTSLIYDDGVNVGIGTNSPLFNLSINSGTSTNAALNFVRSGSTGNGLVIGTNVSGVSFLSYDNLPMFFGTNAVNRMTLTAGGNLGLGVTPTTAKLGVDGNISLDNPAAGPAPDRVIGFPLTSAGNHSLLTIQAKSNSPSASAFNGGSLLLAAGDFNISGAGGASGGEVFIRAGKNVFDGSGGGNIIFQADGLAYTERMRIEGKSGYVGVNTASPTAVLHVNGTTRLVDGTQGQGKVLTSDANGNATWQAVNASSRTRSVIMDVASLDISANTSILVGSKGTTMAYSRPYLQLADNTFQQFQTAMPIPSDWNGTSDFTVTIHYSSPGSSGDFAIDCGYITTDLDQDMTGFTIATSALMPASSNANGLKEGQLILAYHFPTSKNLYISVRRNGADGSDSSNDPMYIHGIKIDYKD